ncbi:DMT family transporter [Nocardia brevicatena]|uniref:DMT family transporter n=1 Tax=Nocardia brevicatena TaxID=37327 RepID=UPI000309408B|nr:DMT family transporter [Nocardia brevicatena]
MATPTIEAPATLPRATTALLFVFILIGGALRSVEAGCQNSLKLALGNVWLCGVVSYAVAFTGFAVFLAIYLIATSRRTGSRRRARPALSDLRSMPAWAPFGGLLGGAAVLAMISVASSVGASTFNALIIAGQMSGALVLDHFGLMGFPKRSVSPRRATACVMIVAGVYLMAGY